MGNQKDPVWNHFTIVKKEDVDYDSEKKWQMRDNYEFELMKSSICKNAIRAKSYLAFQHSSFKSMNPAAWKQVLSLYHNYNYV